jgi:hypothetical protein
VSVARLDARGRPLARWWPAFAVAVAACVLLAVLAPSSWWGVTGVLAVAGLMASLRHVVRERYRAGWWRAAALVTFGAGLGGASYAFAVEPFGPRPVLSAVLGALLVASLAGVAGIEVVGGRGAEYAKLDRYERAVRDSPRGQRRY